MVNKFIGIGHLCQDPKLQSLGEKKKASFSIGINNSKDDVLFLNVECWNNIAENCSKYISKGSCIYVEGRIKTSKWTDKDGNNKTNFYISADVVRFLPNGKKETSEKKVEKRNVDTNIPNITKPNIPDIVTDEEMPF